MVVFDVLVSMIDECSMNMEKDNLRAAVLTFFDVGVRVSRCTEAAALMTWNRITRLHGSNVGAWVHRDKSLPLLQYHRCTVEVAEMLTTTLGQHTP